MTASAAPLTLVIDVHWPAGRYHGQEWPPSPLRLFQALVAGAAQPGRQELPDQSADALRWLETLPAPVVYAARKDACARLETTTGSRAAIQRRVRPAPSVPRNSADKLMAQHAAGDERTKIDELERKLHDLKPLVAWRASAGVRYCWALAPTDLAAAQRVAALALELHALGRGIDFAYATAQIGPPVAPSRTAWTTWTPSAFGMELMEVATVGTLGSATAREEARRQRLARREYVNLPLTARRQRYSDGTAGAPRSWRLFELRRPDGSALASFPQQEAAMVVGMVRHALDDLHRDSPVLRAYATGHTAAADPDARLSWWPLPTLGHAQADGRIRRVLIAGPLGADAAGAFDDALFGLHAAVLHRAGRPLARLVEIGALVSEALPGAVAPLFGQANSWATVLPMVLPGHVSVRAGSRRRLVPRKVEALVQKSLLRAGLPPAVALRYQPAPFFAWGVGARDFAAPAYLRRDSTLLHVALDFPQAVTGPLAIGPGRHYGFGLLHPIAALPPAPADTGQGDVSDAEDEADDEVADAADDD